MNRYLRNTIRNLVLTLLMAVLSKAPIASAQASTYGTYQAVPDYPFVFICEDSIARPMAISDSTFNAIARGIRFKVNKTDIQPSDPFIKVYTSQIAPMLLSKELKLHRVMVRGAASPDGPYENNRRLGHERTARLVEFLGSKINQPIDTALIHAESITEDYAYLVELMRRNADRDAATVQRIWLNARGSEPACKRALMAYNGGKLWRRLLKEYFPQLRQARVVLWFGKKVIDEPVTDAVEFSVLPEGVALGSPDSINVALPALEFEPTYTRRHLIAARTNLVHDFFVMPQFGFAPGINIQLEYYPLNGHYTYNAGFTWTNHRHWDTHEFFQIRDLRLELRRYFKGEGKHIGGFLDANAHGSMYGIGLSPTKGWQGEGGGAGVGAGYTWKLNRRGSLRMEVSAQVGFFVTKYDPYVWGNPVTGTITGDYYYDYTGRTSDFKKRNHRFSWLGPTNFGIHITYDIIYRKRKPSGYRLLQKGGAL